MTEKLVVNSERNCVRITWEFEDDLGGNLGDCDPGDLPDDEERLELEAMHAAANASRGVSRDSYGFRWEIESQARSALRAIKAAAKAAQSAREGKPWPGWAVSALAAGWKAPKGWKP